MRYVCRYCGSRVQVTAWLHPDGYVEHGAADSPLDPFQSGGAYCGECRSDSGAVLPTDGADVFDAGFDCPSGWVHVERDDEIALFPNDAVAARAVSESWHWYNARTRELRLPTGLDAPDAPRVSGDWYPVVPEQDAKKAGLL